MDNSFSIAHHYHLTIDFHLENTTISMLFQAKYLHLIVIAARGQKSAQSSGAMAG
jgi:hypothetical protein